MALSLRPAVHGHHVACAPSFFPSRLSPGSPTFGNRTFCSFRRPRWLQPPAEVCGELRPSLAVKPSWDVQLRSPSLAQSGSRQPSATRCRHSAFGGAKATFWRPVCSGMPTGGPAAHYGSLHRHPVCSLGFFFFVSTLVVPLVLFPDLVRYFFVPISRAPFSRALVCWALPLPTLDALEALRRPYGHRSSFPCATTASLPCYGPPGP